jgi:hypothetical protein
MRLEQERKRGPMRRSIEQILLFELFCELSGVGLAREACSG